MKKAPRAALGAALVALFVAPAGAGEPGTQSRELESALRAIVEGGPLAGARCGIFVADVETGQAVYARNADVLLNPASNVKLVTSAAALSRLGPEYRFATEFYVDAGSARSQSHRALYVRGRGDPTLLTERLWAIAGDLVHLGIRRIGDLVVDGGFFDAERQGPGFDQESGDKAYLAPTGAASLNWNTVAVTVAPGERGQQARVELEPASDFFEIVNRATTGRPGAGRRLSVASIALSGRQRIAVEGRIPAGSRVQTVWRKIDDPSLYLGQTLRRLLELRGVRMAGRVRSGEVPQGAKLALVAESESLAEIVRRLNKTSNNFVAEQILETLGAEAKGAPGGWAKGIAAAEEFLAEIGVKRGAYVMKNGSGLNDANRFSARQLVAVLRAMWGRFPLQAEYVGSLPVAGRDGTIRWRMEGSEAAGRLRAKTGTLDSVTSLSGYVQTAGKRTLAFSLIVNDYPGRPSAAVRSVDAIGMALAASGGPPGALGAAVALAKGSAPAAAAPASAAATADLAAAMRTYYALGREGDQRNLPFLRTALRTETDPALRLAVGECVVLSDPDGEASQRAFLEAIPSDPQVLAQVWLAGAGEEPAPVLPSLGELASEGTPEALAKLVEIAPASSMDQRLATALADLLTDVAASAPEELVAALRAAPPVAQEAAVAALAAGLLRSDERDHPLPDALRTLGQKDGELAAFARSLVPRLTEAMNADQAQRASPALVPAGGAAAQSGPAAARGGR